MGANRIAWRNTILDGTGSEELAPPVYLALVVSGVFAKTGSADMCLSNHICHCGIQRPVKSRFRRIPGVGGANEPQGGLKRMVGGLTPPLQSNPSSLRGKDLYSSGMLAK